MHPSSSFQKQEAGDRDLIKAAVVRGDAVENSMQAVFSCLFIHINKYQTAGDALAVYTSYTAPYRTTKRVSKTAGIQHEGAPTVSHAGVRPPHRRDYVYNKYIRISRGDPRTEG